MIKAKSIQEFNDHYAKKLIIHVIYLNLTVQDHMIETAFILITWLNQYQMILEKTWMNKTDLVINMQINFLQFLKSVDAKKINQSEFCRSELSEICEIKWKNLKLIVTSIVILKRSMNSKLMNQFIESVSALKQSIQVDLNQLASFQSTKTKQIINIKMIETAIYKMLVKWSNVKIFAVIISKNNWLITTVENQSERVNLHELSHVKALEQVKIKLFSEYYNYLDMFNRAMIDQL